MENDSPHEGLRANGNSRGGEGFANCPNCHTALLRGMRFCRQCGYRLGEGIAEYVETVQLDGAPTMAPAAYGTQSTPAWGQSPTTLVAPGAPLLPRRRRSLHHPRRARRLFWFVIAIAIVSASHGRFSFAPFDLRRDGRAAIVSPFTPRSFFGAKSFTSVEGGAQIASVLPNTPADRAGLVGGDIIASFDQQPVRNEEGIRRLLRATPIGKAVEVVYLRDGETKQATLVTASTSDYDSDAFALPERRGFLGIDDLDRVPVVGTKSYGVRVGEVLRNRPADLSGLQEGDVIIEFNGSPIRTVEELASRIARAVPGSVAQVVLLRTNQRVELVVKMGRKD